MIAGCSIANLLKSLYLTQTSADELKAVATGRGRNTNNHLPAGSKFYLPSLGLSVTPATARWRVCSRETLIWECGADFIRALYTTMALLWVLL